jgi:hypothetical protein
MNPAPEVIRALLHDSHTIAVVGLSKNPARPSHEVARYLQTQGYRIIPINPGCAGQYILGEFCYATLTEAAAVLANTGGQIDVVDCFRRKEFIPALADEAIAIGARALWMQLGIVNQEAADKAEQAGLIVVMDRCTKIDHAMLM